MTVRTQEDREFDWNTGRELERKDAEIARLRAALRAVMPIAEAFRGRIDKEPALQIGRAALEQSATEKE